MCVNVYVYAQNYVGAYVYMCALVYRYVYDDVGMIVNLYTYIIQLSMRVELSHSCIFAFDAKRRRRFSQGITTFHIVPSGNQANNVQSCDALRLPSQARK